MLNKKRERIEESRCIVLTYFKKDVVSYSFFFLFVCYVKFGLRQNFFLLKSFHKKK